MKHTDGKQFLQIVLFSALPVMAVAQDMTTAKKINSIKRSGNYIYAEATCPTEKEAVETAHDMLMIEISEYVAFQKNLKGSEQVIMKDIGVSHEQITMPRGEYMRVFQYVPKTEVAVGDKTAAPVALKPVQQPVKELQKEETKNEILPVRQEEAVLPVMTAVEAGANVSVKDAALSDWQTRLAEDIVSKTKGHEVKLALNKYKAQYKVKRIGDKAALCPVPDAALYVLLDESDTVTAVLGPASADGNRIEYKSGRSVPKGTYEGTRHIWFTLSK